jgi:3-deoxy-D-manno-octulosonate 8-phosphate phosphatase KdsC-like HAD superfamily phosphatase
MSKPRTLLADDRNRRTLAIFDIDGVLISNSSEMRQYIEEMRIGAYGTHDWLGWHSEGNHPSHPGWVVMLNLLYHCGVTIALVTARMEHIYEHTISELLRHGVNYDLLIMGRNKAEVLFELRQEFNVVLAVDDDPAHIARYMAADLPAIWVNNHDGPYTGAPEDHS